MRNQENIRDNDYLGGLINRPVAYGWHAVQHAASQCRTPRLEAAATMYRLQNIAVAVSAFSAFVTSFLSPGHFFYWAFVLTTILIGAISSVGCQGSALSVEREWTKALCQGDSASLASLNAGRLQHCTNRSHGPERSFSSSWFRHLSNRLGQDCEHHRHPVDP